MIARLRDLPLAAIHWLIWHLFERFGLVTPTRRR